MKRGKYRTMSSEQRAEISASKRFNKEVEPEKWQQWYTYYLNFLSKEALPASEVSEEGQYVRIRPFHIRKFEEGADNTY